jgi:hypothetical protein
MNFIPKRLSHRAQKLARSILDHEAEDHLLRNGRPMQLPRDPVVYLLDWIVANPRAANEFLGPGEGREATYTGFLKAAEKFGFELIGRFPSFIEGEAVTILGREVDLTMFVSSSIGGNLKEVTFLGEISTVPNPGQNRFDIGSRLNILDMFLELDAMFTDARLAVFGGSPRAFLDNLAVKLVTPCEVLAFYRGRAEELTVVSSDFGNLSSFGRGRWRALPTRWRDRIAASSS